MRIFSNKKSVAFVATATAFTAMVLASAVYAAVTFGPARTTYTWANPANHITFNSITDNPAFGDERQFLKSRDLTSPTTDYATQTQVHDGEDVVLEVYFHNNAASNLNLVAKNTQVKFALPSNTASTLSPTAYISADNATPGQVYASADLTSPQPFAISYIPGSAKLYTNYVNGIAISDNVVKDGALIGTNGPDGNVPGCGQYSGYVTIRAHVTVPKTPVTPTPTPTPTPVTPTVVTTTKALPNTGAGDVLGLFTGASAAGTAVHYAVSRRRR